MEKGRNGDGRRRRGDGKWVGGTISEGVWVGGRVCVCLCVCVTESRPSSDGSLSCLYYTLYCGLRPMS